MKYSKNLIHSKKHDICRVKKKMCKLCFKNLLKFNLTLKRTGLF